MKFSIIIPAYQEKNLKNLINILLQQSLKKDFILEKIIVVACGYDNFPELDGKKIIVIKEKLRRGKATAINTGLKNARNVDIVAVISADIIPYRNTVMELLKPFSDPAVGMTGGRSVPINGASNFIGFAVNTIWELLHLVSLRKTKTGEIIAFRNIIKGIPQNSTVDEASIEAEIVGKGYKIIYCPEAIIKMKGPEKFSDLIKQRKRIFIGHLHLKSTEGYEVSTMGIKRIMYALADLIKTKPTNLLWLSFLALLESYIRLHAMFDFYILKKNPFIWEISRTTKNF